MELELEQGSKEWFLEIAEILGKMLLGIEWSHYPHSSPPTQVVFITQRFYDEFPPAIAKIAGMPGYRHGVFWSVLRGKDVASQVFDFYPPQTLGEELVAEVAAKLGMWADSTNLRTYVRYYRYYHPRLLEIED